MGEAPRYDVLRFLGEGRGGYAAEDAHAVIAVYRLASPVSFDRSKMTSVSVRPEDGVAPRDPQHDPLIIDAGIVHLSVDRQKASHVKTATAAITGGAANLLRDVVSMDWALVWLVPTRALHDDLVARLRRGEACNRPEDGLRLVGRVHQVRKQRTTAPDGKRNVTYMMQMVGFSEFDAELYYDVSIATNDLMEQNVGRWLTRIGVNADAWFAKHASDSRKDNINTILPEILELVLGRGVSKDINAGASAGLSAASGAGAGEDAPNAYSVPAGVGRALGRPSEGAAAYADLLAPFIGVEGYKAATNDLGSFAPTRRADLSGSFLPMFPPMINTPFWSVLGHFLNPAINEMFTCLRVQEEGGEVLPALVARQIPFTTDAFDADHVDNAVTRFTELPRWVIDDTLVLSSDYGRSDATRCNLVHIYGSANDFSNNMNVSKQIAESAPIRDDLDIQRSGPRPYMTTVECTPDDQRGSVRKWMELVGDWKFGSHLTLNGTLQCLGLPGPIAEGDNVEVDGLILHVEGIGDTYQVQPDGKKHWRTVLRLSNGVLASGDGSLHYYGIEPDVQVVSLERADPSQGGI